MTNVANLYSSPQEQEATPTLSATELAMQEFLDRVKDIAGVSVRRHGGKSLAEQTIVVQVPSIMSQEATDVILLKGEMYSKFPGASMRVDITESHDIRSLDSETVSMKR